MQEVCVVGIGIAQLNIGVEHIIYVLIMDSARAGLPFSCLNSDSLLLLIARCQCIWFRYIPYSFKILIYRRGRRCGFIREFVNVSTQSGLASSTL